ncbi:MAG: hypothetical protein HYT97_08565 [Elusimicrobia bacterium]|nr:hypothetical protein [Elusimicrobiota bacterium]
MLNINTTNHKRVNVTLPPQTLKLIDKVTEKGDRSRLIDEAVRFYVKEIGYSNLRKRIREGALMRSSRDLELAEEWFALDNEA